jgi:hypothetical protein
MQHHTIAYAIAHRSPVTGRVVVHRGVASGTDSPERLARFVRISHCKRAELDALPAIAWAPSEPYRAQADASDLPYPLCSRAAWDPSAPSPTRERTRSPLGCRDRS